MGQNGPFKKKYLNWTCQKLFFTRKLGTSYIPFVKQMDKGGQSLNSEREITAQGKGHKAYGKKRR
jgi:hypothetical protein